MSHHEIIWTGVVMSLLISFVIVRVSTHSLESEGDNRASVSNIYFN